MKNILITGANSYIGMSFEKYIKENYSDQYAIDTVDMIDGSWRSKDFSGYDSVFHVAGIAHQKETKENAPLYYKVNRDLAVETADKAKQAGVRQVIFLSSMSVYGMDMGVITKEAVPNPKSNYGKPKLQAEEGIIYESKCGECVPAENEYMLAQKIKDIVADKQLMKMYAENSKRFYKQYFEKHIIMTQLRGVLYENSND